MGVGERAPVRRSPAVPCGGLVEYGRAVFPPPPSEPPRPPRPRPRRRLRLVLGVVAGGLALLGGGAAVLGYFAYRSDAGFPAASYRLTLPRTLVDGRYSLSADLSGEEGGRIEDEADGAWNARDTTAVVARYDLGGDKGRGSLILSGMYGRFRDTADSRANMMKGVGEAGGTQVVVRPRDFELSGTTVTCQVVTQVQLGERITYPVCAWVDGNTGATVGEISADAVGREPGEVDLEGAARLTLQVRNEARKPR